MKILVDEFPISKKKCCFYSRGQCAARPQPSLISILSGFVDFRCVDVGKPNCPLLSITDSCDISCVVEDNELSVILKLGSIEYTIPVGEI